jgi:hypothetical protein
MAGEALQQTQTLSLRISETLRKRLEDIRKLTALRKGESVSTSEIAKQLLESARGDRFETVELLSKPMEAVLEIRRKGEAGQMLSRAQWTVLAYYVQQGSEAFSKNPLSRETYIGILKAFEAAHELRAKPSDNDEDYLGNLPTDCQPERKRSDPVTPELVRKTVAETVRRLSNPATRWTPDLAARNLYVLLDDEKLPGAAALNEALSPYWPVLWRVAARGHYFVHREPVRDSGRRDMVHRAAIPSLEEYFGPKKTDDAKYRLSFARGTGHDFDVLLSFPGSRGPLYPLAPYPMIAEFRAMLAALTPKARPPQHWDGEHFYGYVTERGNEPEFWFRAHANAITFGFSVEEWKAVRELFRRAWEMPEVRIAWDALSLEYGEL